MLNKYTLPSSLALQAEVQSQWNNRLLQGQMGVKGLIPTLQD